MIYFSFFLKNGKVQSAKSEKNLSPRDTRKHVVFRVILTTSNNEQ